MTFFIYHTHSWGMSTFIFVYHWFCIGLGWCQMLSFPKFHPFPFCTCNFIGWYFRTPWLPYMAMIEACIKLK
jgi:hypothetical protein